MARISAAERTRSPDVTRERLLRAAFDEIYRQGFQAASVDDILARAGVTKGALYHHFHDKAALGHAVLEEVIHGLVVERWLGVLERGTGDPVTLLQATLRRRSDALTRGEVELGCPLNNLAQELSPLDEQFRRRIKTTFDAWRGGIAKALARGQAEGSVRRDVDPNGAAAFIVAAIEGSYGLAKNDRSARVLRANLETLIAWLEDLRATSRRRRRTRQRAQAPPRRA